MSHHGEMPFMDKEETERILKKMLENSVKQDDEPFKEYYKPEIGKTGDFPDGMLSETDEGGLAFACFEKDGRVVFDFGCPVQWIGFTPEQAIDIGKILTEKGKALLKEPEGDPR